MVKWPFLPKDAGLEIAKTEGAYLFTPEGHKILDAASGAIVNNIGYGREEVAEAIKEASLNNTYVLPPFLTPEREELLDELRQHWLPSHLTRIHLSSGGSEANESAVKLAIQYQASRGKPEKNIILTRDLSYHGTTLNMSGISGHTARKRGLESYVPAPRTIETPYPLRCPLGSFHPEAKDYYLDNLKEVIKAQGANNIAALLMEPINGSSGGAIYPPEGYWEKAQEILKENDILLIADEVMTGFGRTGVDFSSNFYNLRPDILVAGKGMAAGYAAISGTYSTDEIADSILKAGYEVMFHTFAALPQSCAASTTVLKILRRENLCERVNPLGDQLKQKLISELGQHPLVAEIRGQGLLIGVEIVKEKEGLTSFDEKEKITNQIVAKGLENGVFFYPGGTGEYRDIICLGPAFIINQEDIDLMVNTLKQCLDHIQSKY
ncbi:MAG: aminotransferase class III-fold pyridoxal phosphate-dependent enzyme [SAR86 cluster bacterium]|jgi:adenosylmethionine-8-amino-7-oxononanoate aminotransferase|nr:aminotransferase class III-fold pyridoxal phosphate-dependent enzyme [SAR86 cluster bacterium]